MSVPPANQVPGIYRRRIGDIVVTALSDGYFITEREMTRNLPREELAQALAAAFRDTVVFSVNAFLIQAQGRTCRELAYNIKNLLEKEYYYHATVILAVDRISEKSRGKFSTCSDNARS